MNITSSEKIQIRENKTLKLNNVLIKEVLEQKDMQKALFLMDSYIKTKGNQKVGPLITYTGLDLIGNEPRIIVKILVQLKAPIHNVDKQYSFENQIKVHNCLFARYKEKEENLQFAYSKLQLFAFENDRKLKGDSYTVYISNEDGTITADVFMEEDKSESL